MPQISGVLTCRAYNDELDREMDVTIDRDKFYNVDYTPDTISNPHNIPLDPLSIAFARMMGFSWLAVAELVGPHENGISIDFDGRPDYDQTDTLTLTDDHPCIEGLSYYDYAKTSGIVDTGPRLADAGNQTACITLSRTAMWETTRKWETGESRYVDICHISLNREIPQSVCLGLKQKMEAGQLRLLDIFNIPDLTVNPHIDAIDIDSGSGPAFRVRFPQGDGDGMLSKLNPED